MDYGDRVEITIKNADGVENTVVVNDGVGISKAVINARGELVITYTDGNTVNLGKVVGEGGTGGSGDGIYILGEDEALEDVPEDVNVVLDPDGEASEGGTGDGTADANIYSALMTYMSASIKWDGNIEGRDIYVLSEDDYLLTCCVHIREEVPTIYTPLFHSLVMVDRLGMVSESGVVAGTVNIVEDGGIYYGYLDVLGEQMELFIILPSDDVLMPFKKGIYALYYGLKFENDGIMPILFPSAINIAGHPYNNASST